jgi:hypothetical protein
MHLIQVTPPPREAALLRNFSRIKRRRVNQPLSIFVRNRLIINRKRRAESFDIAADRQAGQSAGRGR